MQGRHASELADFVECLQATLNRHRDKPDLDTLSVHEICSLICEERHETVHELYKRMPDDPADPPDGTFSPRRVESEALDLAVSAFAAWLHGRRMGAEFAAYAKQKEAS